MATELKQLRHVIVAAEHRSFRRAAASLNIKQSTLSRTIREVETELQVQLFERSRAGIRPTAAGAAFIKDVRRVVAEIDRLTETARSAGRGEVGRLKIGLYTLLSAGNLIQQARGTTFSVDSNSFITSFDQIPLFAQHSTELQKVQAQLNSQNS